MASPSPSLPRAPLSFKELYAQILALPEGVTGEILQAGSLETMGRPGKAHRRAAQRLFDRLRGHDRDRGGVGWWLEIEPELHFPAEPLFPDGRLAVPDLCGWRTERVLELPDENPLRVVPDWCCEVLSSSTARKDRRLKLPLYATHGVGHVWLIDPEARLIEVYRSSEGLPTLVASAADETSIPLPPFADLDLDVTALWLSPSEP